MNYRPNKITVINGVAYFEPNYCYSATTNRLVMKQFYKKYAKLFITAADKPIELMVAVSKTIKPTAPTFCAKFLTILCAYFLLPTFSAYAFDIGAGMTALVDPFVAAVNAHYGKVILLLGAAGAAIAQGDLRTRALGFGVGSSLAGGTMLLVKAGLGI